MSGTLSDRNETLRATIALTVNGRPLEYRGNPERSLLDFLREDLDLIGAKDGCGIGRCGSCTVLVNGRALRACVTGIGKVEGKSVLTIEGLGGPEALHPLQKAFLSPGASQCGFCSSGMILAAKRLLDLHPDPSEGQIRRGLKGNLCRCTGYEQIVECVRAAAAEMRGEIPPAPPDRDGLRGPDWIIDRPAPLPDYRFVGRSLTMHAAVEKVTGRLRYTDDIKHPGALWVKARRAGRAHARILSLDAARALAMPGVVRVITAEDIPGENLYGKSTRDIPVIADERVRFPGDVLALVVAEDRASAERAAEAIDVRFEDLPAVFDPAEALREDAPKVHEGGNLLYGIHIEKGDAAVGLAEAEQRVQDVFETPFVDHAQMEPEAALSYYEKGKLTVVAPTQHVYFDRLNIFRALGIPAEDVHVLQPPVGGAFGKREDVYGQIHVALATFLTGRPCRTRFSREETLRVTQKRHPFRIAVELGASRDGRLTGLRADLLSNSGAYASWGENVLRKAAVHVSGPYEIPSLRIDARCAYTNNPYCGAMRGFGTIQAAFAYESAMDMLAGKLKIDPLEFRRRNLFRDGSRTATGQLLETGGRALRCLEAAAEHAPWRNEDIDRSFDPERYRIGRGVACGWYGIGFGAGIPDSAKARIELRLDGSARVWVSTVDYGQGSSTIFRQVAAEALGLHPDRIDLITGDSAVTPNCGSTVATRQTFVTGNAIVRTAKLIREDLLRVAAEELGCEQAAVSLGIGRASVGGREIAVSELAAKFRERGHPLRRESIFKADRYTTRLDPETGQGDAYFPYAFCAHAAEIRVEIKTGRVKVIGYTAAHHVGRALNPALVRGQIVGGVQMGLGYGLSEDLDVREGVPRNDNFDRYRTFRTTDMPPVLAVILEDGEATGPFGAIGIGEPPAVPVAPAICNAIYDAVGARIRSLPATPERILEAMP